MVSFFGGALTCFEAVGLVLASLGALGGPTPLRKTSRFWECAYGCVLSAFVCIGGPCWIGLMLMLIHVSEAPHANYAHVVYTCIYIYIYICY